MGCRYAAGLCALILLAGSTVGAVRTQAAAAAAAPAGSACPPLLTLVESLPESTIMAEILMMLGADDTPPATASTQRGLLSRRALTATATACPAIYRPVCGVDNTTYGNECSAGRVKVACEGECPCKQDATPCPTNYLPVCGVDGVTYGNDCQATANKTTVACKGGCPCKPVARPCPAIYAPVCGVDLVTYASECVAGPTPIACQGECPCKGSEAPTRAPAASTGDGAACIAMVDPVCGVDGKQYSNQCTAGTFGVEVQCKGRCPCPALTEALQRRPGGVLLVPTDDALLAMLNATTPGDWMADTQLLQQILARHVILTSNQPGRRPVKPTERGTRAVTEAGQALRLFAANPQEPARVQPVGPGQEAIEVLDQAKGCRLVVMQIAAPLEGPGGTA